MRIVWASAFFLAGTGAAIVFGFAPGFAIPTTTFLLFFSAVVLAVFALVVSRRRAAYALLAVVFLIGCWRGSDAIADLERIEDPFSTASDSVATVWIAEGNILDRVRHDIGHALTQTIGASKAGLSIALLTGDRAQIKPDLVTNFRSAGLAHLLAISGLHVSLIGGIAMSISVFAFGRKRGIYILIPLALVLAYAAVAGFAPPVTRAAIMFGVFILGRVLGRGSHTLAALALAAMVMIAFEPAILASLSFQLSFAAMLGISFVAPMLEGTTEISTSRESSLERNALAERIRRFVVGSLVVSIAATIGTLPLVALHFDAVPIWGVLATLLAVPAVPILIVSSAIVVAGANLPIPILPDVLALPVVATTNYLTFIADIFANLAPSPIQTGSWSVWMSVFYFAAVAIAVLSWPRLKSFSARFRPSENGAIARVSTTLSKNATFAVLLSVVLLATSTAIWSVAMSLDKDASYFSVRFLQTSHGESIFIETPNGNRMLVDGGGNASQVADTLGSMLPFWDREIDIVLLTHPDTDHVGGLAEVLRRFPVGAVLHSGQISTSNAFASWSKAVEDHDNAVTVWPGMLVGLDHNTTIEVLSGGCGDTDVQCVDNNDASIVTMLRHRDVSFLLTGDIEHSAEIRLATSIPKLHATVLKAPHHGSNTSSTATLINAVEPVAAVIAAGTANRYGHPHPEVIERYNANVGQERVFRTDQVGTVELRTDGERLWMVR